eukprot:gene116-4362_t
MKFTGALDFLKPLENLHLLFPLLIIASLGAIVPIIMVLICIAFLVGFLFSLIGINFIYGGESYLILILKGIAGLCILVVVIFMCVVANGVVQDWIKRRSERIKKELQFSESE